jgi:hypothetical protein
LENTKGFITKNKTDFPKKPKKGKKRKKERHQKKKRLTMTMRCCRSGKLTKEFASIPIRVRCNKNSQYGKHKEGSERRRKEVNAQQRASSRGKKTVTGCQPVTTRVQSPRARG